MLARSLIIGLIFLGIGGFSSLERAQGGFTIRDLGVISPGGTSGGLAISDSGQAAGMATLSAGSSMAVSSQNGGTFNALPVVNALSSVATGIDGAGNICGSMVDATDRTTRAFTVMGQAFHELGPLKINGNAGSNLQANGISGGQIVGTGLIPGRFINGVYVPLSNMTQTAFRGAGSGSLTVINPLGTGLSNTGTAINSQGTVVGTSEISVGGALHAFIAPSNGPVMDLLSRNAAGSFVNNTEANAINDTGDIVGDGIIGGHSHAFFASHAGGSLVDLGLMGGSSSVAYGVNNLANPLVVGEVDYGSSPDAFLWQSGVGMRELRSLLSPSDQAIWSQLSRATGINAGNQVVGQGIINGQVHGFLLTPVAGQSIFSPAIAVPEPPSLVLIALGGLAAGLSCCFRRGRTEGRVAA